MSETLRVATYNVHGCVGLDGNRSESRIAEVIASMSVDIVGLQELDLNRARSAGVDQAALIAKQLGWHHLFAAAMRHASNEDYGNAVISRYPITLRRAIPLPGSGTWYCRETRVALWAEIQTALGRVHVVNTHFGLGRPERLAQSRLLASVEQLGAHAANEPLILLGDFNSRRGSRALRVLREFLQDVREVLGGAHRTFPTRFPLIAVDHIFANAALRPVAISSHRTPLSRLASDHFPLVAEFARS
ncbi:MAG TPA: endonuclease/exonuclease/phosphatase family protein [Chthoniobacterales bacterium]